MFAVCFLVQQGRVCYCRVSLQITRPEPRDTRVGLGPRNWLGGRSHYTWYAKRRNSQWRKPSPDKEDWGSELLVQGSGAHPALSFEVGVRRRDVAPCCQLCRVALPKQRSLPGFPRSPVKSLSGLIFPCISQARTTSYGLSSMSAYSSFACSLRRWRSLRMLRKTLRLE